MPTRTSVGILLCEVKPEIILPSPVGGNPGPSCGPAGWRSPSFKIGDVVSLLGIGCFPLENGMLRLGVVSLKRELRPSASIAPCSACEENLDGVSAIISAILDCCLGFKAVTSEPGVGVGPCDTGMVEAEPPVCIVSPILDWPTEGVKGLLGRAWLHGVALKL